MNATSEHEIEAAARAGRRSSRRSWSRLRLGKPAVAEAQEQTYWLERWHVDLNALMRTAGRRSVTGRPGARRSSGRAPGCRRLMSGDGAREPASVVIPVKDGERYLDEVLAALRREGVDEMLVIDSGSQDRSVEIARAGRRSS